MEFNHDARRKAMFFGGYMRPCEESTIEAVADDVAIPVSLQDLEITVRFLTSRSMVALAAKCRVARRQTPNFL